MGQRLDDAALAHYREFGYLHPIRVLPAEDAAGQLERLEAYEARTGGPIDGIYRHKSHVLFPWLYDLVCHPGILDAVEDVLGPDLLCWGSSFFIKEGKDPGYVSWHQDSTYWGLSRPDVVTAWVAFTPSTVQNGCMRVLPESHGEQLGHEDTYAAQNMLSRGQVVAAEVDQSRVVDIELAPGEMSLHHVRLIHGSSPNPSGERRVGFAIRYIPTDLYQVNGERDFAALVRGEDRHGHFELEPRPEAELHPAALELHGEICRVQADILYSDAKTEPFRSRHAG